MRYFMLCISLGGLFVSASAAEAAIIFTTQSTATQSISSPLFGPNPVQLSAVGPQVFSIDTAAGTANVISALTGSDLPDPLNPGGFLTYSLANTATTGTIVTNPDGTYNVDFQLLFELMITSGPLSGITFETLQNSTFAASNIPTIPFPPGTAFSDPLSPDITVIFLKSDPNNILAGLGINIGDPIGVSFGRVVTIDAVTSVPEPTTLVVSIGMCILGVTRPWLRQRRTAPVSG